MSQIEIQNLTFAYGGAEPVFKNVNLTLDTDWKLGLIGRNGRGKTTLLNILADNLEYSGRIVKTVSPEYSPPPLEDPSKVTLALLESIPGFPTDPIWPLERELSLLEMPLEILERPFISLSGGERTRVLLALMFSQEGLFPLLDEPTSHLDLKAREKTASYLSSKRGFICVSHDRHFLDSCVDHILSINNGGLEIIKGNFSLYEREARLLENFRLERDRQIRAEIGKLESSSRRLAGWSNKAEAGKKGAGPVDRGYIGHKAAKLMKRSKASQKKIQKALEEKKGLLVNREEPESLDLPLLSHSSQTHRLAQASELEIFYGQRLAVKGIGFSLAKGQRLALVGKNGSGKTSLLRLLAGDGLPSEAETNIGHGLSYRGSFKIASNLAVNYLPQDPSGLMGSLSGFIEKAGLDKSLFMTCLKKLGFLRKEFDSPLESYSLGQKKKVLLAKCLCRPTHLLLWDEPLNYLDIFSRMQIEELILRRQPSMIFSEHDWAFIKKVATDILEMP